MKSNIIVALLIMNMVISASAQNQNQYGLVYRDAVSYTHLTLPTN